MGEACILKLYNRSGLACCTAAFSMAVSEVNPGIDAAVG